MANTGLLAAGILAVALGVIHSWLGEQRILGPLLAPARRQGILASSAFVRQVLRYAWHLTSLAWWGMGAVLAALAFSPLDPQGRIVLACLGVTFLVTGIVILVTSRGRHLAWPAFLAIAGLSAAPLL